jgi:erythromycin esterase-like protein
MRISLTTLAVVIALQHAAPGQTDQPIQELLKLHQYDLAGEGRALLEKEAKAASFFLIGGLHGDKETPALVDSLWPSIGYQYLAAEMSPWAASRLKASYVRGSDIEELQPHSLVGALAELNPQNKALQSMVELTKGGYKRPLAPQLLELARGMNDVKDSTPGGISLRQQVLRTLEVEAERANRKGNDRLLASMRREAVMKEFFLSHYRAAGGKPKVMAVLGQNHLHRGIDRRGVSTLGNFIAELAAAEGVQSFHAVLFAAGGKINYFGIQEIDQRKDDPAFGVFASAARFAATVFDLRPLRRALHQIPLDKLSAADAGVLYWADAYDAMVCYREVTPAD